MKTTYRLFFSAFAVFLFWSGIVNAQDWECEECPRRTIGLFDCDVQVPQPTWGGTISLSEWLEFNFIASGINAEIFSNDPSRDCLSFYDGQFVLAAESMPDFDSLSYQTNYNWQNLPGSGTLSYVNYIIHSKLSPIGFAGYEITVLLETGKTREVVTSNTIQYNPAIPGVNNGKNAAQFLKPLMGKIREFEKQKRNQLSDVAIEASLEVKPKKFYLNTNESTLITLILKDCDDFRLPNREINLTVNSGTLSSYSVITNQDGEAQITYTAGSSPAWVEIYAEHVYYYPHGSGEIVAAGAEFISVNKSPADVWDFRATVNVQVNVKADTSWTIAIADLPTITDFKSRFSSYSGKLTVFGLIQNECGGYGNEFCYTGNEPPILWFAYGNAAEFSKDKDTEYLSGTMEIFEQTVTFCNELSIGSELRTDNYNIRTDDVGVYLEYSDIVKYFDVGGYGESEANYRTMEWVLGGNWETNQGAYSRSAQVQISWTEPEPHGSFTCQDSAYSLSYSGTETIYESHYDYGIIQTTITKSLTGRIKPYYSTINGLNDGDLNLIPASYDLSNYPNPFNSSTEIRYQLPVSSRVEIKIFDMLGNELTSLVNTKKSAGTYEVEFNPAAVSHPLSSGIYFCRLQTENYSKSIKVFYLK